MDITISGLNPEINGKQPLKRNTVYLSIYVITGQVIGPSGAKT